MHGEPRPPYLVAEIWRCGDEVCDCWQPQITLISPHDPPMPPWIRRDRKWEGTFISDPDNSELQDIRSELRTAAAKYGIVLDEATMTGLLEAPEDLPGPIVTG